MRGEWLLDSYLSVLGLHDHAPATRLLRGQFHDVVLAGDVAYRFPRDEESRRMLPARVALLDALAAAAAGSGLAAALIPQPLAAPDMSQPVGRCHAALRRLPGRQLTPGEAGSPGVLGELARVLDALGELGKQPGIRAAAGIPRLRPVDLVAITGGQQPARPHLRLTGHGARHYPKSRPG